MFLAWARRMVRTGATMVLEKIWGRYEMGYKQVGLLDMQFSPCCAPDPCSSLSRSGIEEPDLSCKAVQCGHY